VHLAQRSSGLHADLLDQDPPCDMERRKRVGLLSAAIQREHQLSGEAFTGRMRGYQLAQLARERRMPTSG
jgi:hypothetical protein